MERIATDPVIKKAIASLNKNLFVQRITFSVETGILKETTAYIAIIYNMAAIINWMSFLMQWRERKGKRSDSTKF